MSHAHRNEWIRSKGPPHTPAPTPNDVFSILESLDVATAARLLRDMKLHYLLVTDRNTPSLRNLIGVLTEGDIVAAVAREADPRSVRVEDVMTRLAAPVPMERALAVLPEPPPPRNVVCINTPYAYLGGLVAPLVAVQRILDRLRNVAAQMRRPSSSPNSEE